MWKRLRRRTMAPRRPAVLPDQLGIVLAIAILAMSSLALVAWALLA